MFTSRFNLITGQAAKNALCSVVNFLFSNANLMRSAIGFGRREMGMMV